MSALIQRAPPHVGPVIQVVGLDNPVVPVHSVAGPVIPVEVPVRSAAGPVVPVHSVPVHSAAGPVVPVHSVPVRSAAGPVVPVAVPVIPVVMPVHSVAGPVVPVVVPVIPVVMPVCSVAGPVIPVVVQVVPVFLQVKEIAGKSPSIQKKIKLPTQVALDTEGLLRTDFPFDQISARQKLRTLTHHTLFPVHPKKKTMEDWIANQKSTESLTVTTTSSSGDPSNVSFVFGETKYGSYSCVDVQGTQEMMDGGSDVTNDAGGEDVTNNKNNNNMSSESTLGLAELFPSTPNATVAESSLDDSPVDNAQRSGDSMTIGTVPETSFDELQGDADESDVTVTEKSTGINRTAQVGQSALLVGGDGEKHVTIMVHSDVTGLVARISKQWKEYSKCMKNLSLTTSPVVSLPHLHSTAPPSKPAIGTNVYNMTTSVTSKDASGKKIKIYVDEDLDIEHKMIEYRMRERKEDPTKGPEIGNYFLFASISFLEIV